LPAEGRRSSAAAGAAGREAAPAALDFWLVAAQDARISKPFRRICAANARALKALLG
jgi:hypothetical protein